MLRGLHDMVKFHSGPGKYECLFHPDAHFAHRTNRIPGTTDRLAKWLDRLADCITRGKFPPVVIGIVILFFARPSFEKEELAALHRNLPWCESQKLDDASSPLAVWAAPLPPTVP